MNTAQSGKGLVRVLCLQKEVPGKNKVKVKSYAEFLPMVNIVGNPECGKNTPKVFSPGRTKTLCKGFQICMIIRITWEALERRF